MDEGGEDWVGAWWVGFLVCGLLSLILAVLVTVLPPKIYRPGLNNPSDDQVGDWYRELGIK